MRSCWQFIAYQRWGEAIFLKGVAPGRPKALPEWPHTKEYLVIFVACFGFVIKRRLRFGWVGRGRI